jgi:hypothetical protein
LSLANKLDAGDSGKFLIDQLVAHAIEAIMLSQLDPNGSYDFLGGKTPKERLADLKAEKTLINALRQSFRDALPNMTEAELLSYTERQRLYGEVEAMRWLRLRSASLTPDRLP